MKLSDSQFYALYGTYEYLILEMELKLLDARKKVLNGNYKDAEDKIEMLKVLRNSFHQMWHDSLTDLNLTLKTIQERERLLRKIAILERENNNLKQTLQL